MTKPTIGFLQGDACGIGPELMSKLLADKEVCALANILIVSDKAVLEAGEQITGNKADVLVIDDIENIDFSDGRPNLLDKPHEGLSELTPGKVSSVAGAAVLKNLGLVLELAQSNIINGICFTPFNKQALHMAGMGAEDELTWI